MEKTREVNIPVPMYEELERLGKPTELIIKAVENGIKEIVVDQINPKEWTMIEDIHAAKNVIDQSWEDLIESFPSNIVMIRRKENRIEILPVSVNVIA